MKSKWFGYKKQVLELRAQGVSMTTIEREFGIARSTLSGWFKEVTLTEEQRISLMKNKIDGWKLARERAVISHRAQKAKRLADAEIAAKETLDKIQMDEAILDLALAMLYLGEGGKGEATNIASSDPLILNFVLTVLRKNYNLDISAIRCELHLRADQDPESMKKYWSNQLSLPLTCFRYHAVDKRTIGRPTYEHYKGVCVLQCGNIAIQRKLIYIYKLFCDKVISELGD